MNYMTSGQNMRITLDNNISNGKVMIDNNKSESLPWELHEKFSKILILKNIVIAFDVDEFDSFATILDNLSKNDLFIEAEDDLEPIETRINSAIEKYLRPNIEADGGTIVYNRFDEETGIAYVTLGGACSGCSASSQTLEYAVNNVLINFVPEIVEVQGDFAEPSFDDGMDML